MEIISGKQPQPLKAVIYGPEGVGKSSLAAQFPKPLFIDVEGGTSELDVMRTPAPTSWAHFQQIIAELVRDQQGFETLVIDTADWLETLAIKQVCAQNGYSSMGGNSDYGKSYNELLALWSDLLTQLEADFIATNRMHVVFLAHAVTRKFELPEEEGQFDRYTLSLEKKIVPLLKEWPKLLLFVNFKTIVTVDDKKKTTKAAGGTVRKMYAEHTAAYDAKNRFGLPFEMDMGFAPLAVCFPALRQQPAPVHAPAPAPATPAPSAPTVTPDDSLSPSHKSLQAMMAGAGVTYDQVLAVLVARGRFPEGTPFENIPPEFIDGWINTFWAQILEMIENGKAA